MLQTQLLLRWATDWSFEIDHYRILADIYALSSEYMYPQLILTKIPPFRSSGDNFIYSLQNGVVVLVDEFA